MTTWGVQKGRPLVIEASAGTGKTFTIKELFLTILRKEYAQNQNFNLRQILVVTFTEKAAGELQERIRQAIEKEIEIAQESNDSTYRRYLRERLVELEEADITTIHGFCNKLLARFAFELQLPRQMELVDVALVNEEEMADFILNRWPILWGEHYQELWRLNEKYQWKMVQSFKVLAESYNPTTDKVSYRVVKDMSELLVDVRELEEECLLLSKGILAQWPQFRNWVKESIAEKDFVNFEKKVLGLKPPAKGQIEKTLKRMKKDDGEEAILFEEYLIRLDTYGLKIALLEESLQNVKTVFLGRILEDYGNHLEDVVKERQIMTYNHMIAYVSEGLKTNIVFKEAVSRHYHYGIIDEFQDTNGLMWDIFKNLLLKEDRFLALVGDPKQSIYRFQGAQIEVYQRAKRDVLASLGGTMFQLDTNYRSSEKINRLSAELFAEPFWFGNEISQVKTGFDKVAIEGNWPYNDKALLVFPECNFSKMAQVILQYVQKIKREGLSYINSSGESCRLNLKDMAILTKSNDDAEKMAVELGHLQIPAHIYKQKNFLENPIWKELIFLIEGLDEYPAKSGMQKLMWCPWLSLEYREDEHFIRDKALHLWIQQMLNLWGEQNYAEFFNSIEKNWVGFRKNYLKYKYSHQANFRYMVKCVVEYLTLYPKTMDLFLIELRKWVDGRKIIDERFDVYVPDLDSDQVQIMTMHASKGLEFPVVFCVSGNFSNSAKVVFQYDDDAGKKLFVSPSNEVKEMQKKEEIEEFKRLFYVAYTRASLRVHHFFKTKNAFLMSDILNSIRSKKGDGAIVDDVLPCEFINEIYVEQKEKKISNPVRVYRHDLQSYSSIVNFAHPDEERVSEKIEKGVYQDDGLPAGPEFGTLVHELIEQIKWGRQKQEIEWENLQQWPIHFSKEQQSRLLTLLQRIENLQFKEGTLKEVSNQYAELEFFLDFTKEDSTLWGFIDLVYKMGDKWYVLDWKTNRLPFYNPSEIHRAMLEHEYPLQAKVYLVALHRWLKKRDRNYDPAQHLGGARYVFVRGLLEDLSSDDFVWSWNPTKEEIKEIETEIVPSILVKAKEELWLQSR